MRYDGEVADPWFNITVQINDSLGTAWQAPVGISVLGCLEQYQFCLGDTCSKLDALYQHRTNGYGLKLTVEQRAVADLMWKSLWAAQLQYSLTLTGNQILLANEAVLAYTNKRSTKLPTDQWVTEAQNFANISLAMLQRRTVEYASPPLIYRNMPNYLIPPDSDAARALCSLTLVRSEGYTSFKGLGLIILPMLALFLTLTNAALGTFARQQTPYHYFELLRLALQSMGHRDWEGSEKTAPTIKDQEFRFSLQESGFGGPSGNGILLEDSKHQRS